MRFNNKETKYHEIKTEGNIGDEINKWKETKRNIAINKIHYNTISLEHDGLYTIVSGVLIEYTES